MDGRPFVSRRLKAARWLAGDVDEKGRATPLSVKDLAARQPLADNGITANRLEEFEQQRVDARPMELEKIADALGLPRTFFVSDPESRRAVAAQALEALEVLLDDPGRQLEPVEEASPEAASGRGRRPRSAGGGRG